MLVDGPACRHCGCGGLLLWDWWQSALAAIKMGQRRSVALYDIFHETCMRSKFLYIFAIGICTVIGKHAILWQPGLVIAGLWSFFLSAAINGVVNLMLTYCLAEMVSIIPFSGGCYGYVRCTEGPYLGFMAGCIEACKYILFTAIALYCFGSIFLGIYQFEEHWLLAVWAGFLVGAMILRSLSLPTFYLFCCSLALAILLSVSIVLFGACRVGERKNLSHEMNEFNTSTEIFLQGLAFSGYFFAGIDTMRTCVDNESSRIVPTAMVVVMALTIVIALMSIIAIRSYVFFLPSIMASFFPYSVVLQIALPHIQQRFVDLFSLAGITGAALGFFYGGAKQVSSMIGSRLLPLTYYIISRTEAKIWPTSESNEAPPPSSEVSLSHKTSSLNQFRDTRLHNVYLLSFGFCSVTVYIVLAVGYFTINNFLQHVVEFVGILTVFEVVFMMIAYMIFYTRYSNLRRGLRSPFGLVGPVFVIVLYALLFGCNFYFQKPNDRLWQGLTLLFFWITCTIYYFVVVKDKQFFSAEEQEHFMKAYIVNANTRKRKEIRGRQGHSGLHKWFRHGAAIGSASTVFLSMQSMMNPSTHLIAGSGSHLRPISQTVTNDPSILDECSNAGQSVRVKHNQQGSQVPAAQSREIDYIVHDVE